ncbi:hypothetical protein [Chryseobacterium gambrini]|uniref:hypothetical protein n=1 Tax=Chryseobacterium gambrini TaxID=373672 RepID=UPI003D0C09C8
MAGTSTKLETLRVNVWKMGKLIEKLNQDNELMKCQIIELESIEKETEKNGVEAVEIDPERILTRRGSNSKKLALAQAMNKDKK